MAAATSSPARSSSGARSTYPRRSTIDDNPSLNREAYKETLKDIHPTRREQLLEGNWDARDPGDYFREEWFGPLIENADELGERIKIRWWDLAASEKDDAARTAGVLMSRLASGVRVVEHAVAFRRTPGKRDAKIVSQALIDGRGTIVGLEIEGGSGGPAQFETLSKQLRKKGIRVVGARPRAREGEKTEEEKKTLSIAAVSDTGKMRRAEPVASCLERGYQRRGECDETDEPWWGLDMGQGVTAQRDGLRLVAGVWTQSYLDEIEGFPEQTLKDLVDATSGAWAWLEAHPYGARRAPDAKRPEPASSHNTHPDDRPELDEDHGRSRTGHYTP